MKALCRYSFAFVVGGSFFACTPAASMLDAGLDVVAPLVEGGLPPADAPDAGGPSCGSEYTGCNPATNVPCGAGEACYPTGPLAASCQMAGRGGANTACMTPDQCQEGLGCIGGKCTKYCCTLGETTQCRTGPNGRPGAICNINLGAGSLRGCTYIDICDVVAQTGCPMAQPDCFLIGADGTTQCGMTNGASMPNTACVHANDCPRGYSCSGPAGGAQMCRQFCDPSGMSMGMFARCPMGFTCGRLSMQPATIGVCNPM